MKDPWAEEVGQIYLVHFDQPIGDPTRPNMSAQHYLGWAIDVPARLDVHRSGGDVAIMRHLKKMGIGFQLVLIQPGTRNQERALKKSGHYKDRLCPICKEG